MEKELYEQIAKSFAKNDVQYVGESERIALFSCVVDEDGMGMFIVIPKSNLQPRWSNGNDDMEKEIMPILSSIPEQEDEEPPADEKPLFMNDKSWYMFDDNGKIILTTKAPPEAVDSYFEWLADNPR